MFKLLSFFYIYYDYLKPKYLDRCKLLSIDTDSFCCHIQTEDLYHDMSENIELFDTSNFGKTHPLYTKTNHRIVGKFKSETGSLAPLKFVGLRAKMYSLFVPHNPKECKIRAKGIKRSYVKKKVRHDQFLTVLKTLKPTPSTFSSFQSINHVLRTVAINKTCLNAFDDRRYILQDGIVTLACGHFRIPRVAMNMDWALLCVWVGDVYYTWIELCYIFWHGLLFEHCRDMYLKTNRGVWHCILRVWILSLYSNIDVVSRRLLLYFKSTFDWTICLWIKWIIAYTCALVLNWWHSVWVIATLSRTEKLMTQHSRSRSNADTCKSRNGQTLNVIGNVFFRMSH